MEDSTRRMWLTGAGLLGAAAIARGAAAGSLDPPPGPVTPTMRTLDQVEPRTPVDAAHTPSLSANDTFTLSLPGSYYLTGNISGSTAYVIHITAPGVTLDLNGFAVTGVGSTVGILIDGVAERCTVRDGSISGCAYGLADNGTHGSHYSGISVGGSTVEGIKGGFGTSIDGCSAQGGSGFIGIHAYDGSSVTRCTVANATSSYGIAAEAGSTVAHCAVRAVVLPGAAVSVEAGIWTGAGCTVIGCALSGNTGLAGIYLTAGSTITDCTVYNQGGAAATSAGIYAAGVCTVSRCTVRGLAGAAMAPHGFVLADGCTVTGCTSNGNKGDGFQYGSNCLVTNNVSRGNTGHGFHGTGSGNRIDGNLASSNAGTGILASAATADSIVRNSSSGNGTSYNPASGASFGPLSTPGAATSPWSNF